MRVVDLFAGCGGMSRGFEDADFEVTLAIELWQPARKVYQANFESVVLELDLGDVARAVKVVKKERPDVIVGGPPCQEFSPAGQRVEGDKAALTVSFAEIVCAVRPKWFVLENVQAIQNSETWRQARQLLVEAGYGITESVLNAAYFGVPQLRKRFFAIGCLGAEHGFLNEHLERPLNSSPLSIRDYLGDEFGLSYYYRHPRNWGRKGIFSVDEPSPTVRSTNRRVAPGYKAHPNDAGPLALARPLSPAERARVQTFESDFKFDGFDTWKDVMIANAVPVKLAFHVANAIKTHESIDVDSNEPAFRLWLADGAGFTPRTVSNVLSRMKRASKILGSSVEIWDLDVAIAGLEKKSAFCDLQPSVRSQIRRAIRLRKEFILDKN